MNNEERDRTRPEWPKFEEKHYRDPATGDLLFAEWRHFMPPRMNHARLWRVSDYTWNLIVSADTGYTRGSSNKQPQHLTTASFVTRDGHGASAIRQARALFADFAAAAENRKEHRNRYKARLRTRKALAAVAARVPRDANGRFARKGA